MSTNSIGDSGALQLAQMLKVRRWKLAHRSSVHASSRALSPAAVLGLCSMAASALQLAHMLKVHCQSWQPCPRAHAGTHMPAGQRCIATSSRPAWFRV